MEPRDVVQRAPVWEALSELFLDVALSQDDLDRLATVLAASPYSVDELDAILGEELLPVLGRNGTTPAGEWRAFDPAWLAEAIVRQRSRRLRWPRWLLPRGLVREPWARLRARIVELRGGTRDPR